MENTPRSSPVVIDMREKREYLSIPLRFFGPACPWKEVSYTVGPINPTASSAAAGWANSPLPQDLPQSPPSLHVYLRPTATGGRDPATFTTSLPGDVNTGCCKALPVHSFRLRGFPALHLSQIARSFEMTHLREIMESRFSVFESFTCPLCNANSHVRVAFKLFIASSRQEHRVVFVLHIK